MASSITLSAATRQNLLSLQDTANLLSTTQSRLSTGKKVNSALDNPTNFFTSQSLTARSSDLSNLLDGISNGVQTIQAANQGITSIQKLVDSAKSTANQALADKSATTSGQAAAAASVSGSKTFQGLAGTADGTQDFSSVAKDGSIDLSLDGGKTYTTIRLDSETLASTASDLTKVTADQVVKAINNQITGNSALKGQVSASVASDGRITFSTTSTGATQQLNVRGSGSATYDIGFGKGSSQTGASVSGTAATFTAGAVTVGANQATFTINDGNQSLDITIDSSSLDAAGVALGAAATTDDRLAEAIQRKLNDAGMAVDVSLAGSPNTNLKFTSRDVGSTSTLTIVNKTSTLDIGFGTAAGGNGTSVAGTGTAATGLSSVGSDATDGSAKAALTGSKVIAAATGGPPATAGGLDFSAANDASFTLQLGSGPAKKITLNNSTILSTSAGKAFTSAQDVADTINAAIKADTGLAGNVLASVDANNKLVVSTTAAGSTQKLTITAAQGTTVANNLDIGFGTQTSTINGTATNTAVALTSSGKDSTGSTNSTRQSLARQFNELLNQITQQAKDSSYNGVNLLWRSGDDASENTLRVTFNENGSSNLDIKGVKLDADGLGLTSVTGGFQSDDEIKATLSAITSATSTLRSQASTFGSNLSVVQNRQDFSKNLINILDTGSANLTNADLNEEAANSQALSTRNSLAISALSLANQSQQGILQLLR
ncbi:flagellin [Methylobacterium oryzisoli]|uniref:flagellin N-terminal helical domain-containing protein n=1 Tax=Methylobacterium oryzisoli TaxID=3385502 RepID=UPI003892B422